MSYQTDLPQTQCFKSSQSHQYRTKYWSAHLVIVLVISCLVLLIGQQANASCEAVITKRQVAQATTDNIARLSELSWVDIPNLPDRNKTSWQNDSPKLWYRILWRYHCNDDKKLPVTLLISRIRSAGKIYINNEFLWQDRSLTEPISLSWNMPRYWYIPASNLHQGENELSILVIRSKTQAAGLGDVMIGNDDVVFPEYKTYWFRQRALHIADMLLSFSLGIVAFFVWIFYRKESLFGWFSLNALFSVLLINNSLLLDIPFGFDSADVTRSNVIFMLAYAVSNCLFAWRLAQRRFLKIEQFLFSLLAVVTLTGLLIPDSLIIHYMYIGYAISVLIILGNFCSYTYLAYQAKSFESYLLAIIFVFFTYISIHDLLIWLGWSQHRIGTPYIAPLSTILIAVILAKRMASNIHKIEAFNHTLEDSIAQAKQELQDSLNQQHKLELENIKLQERIHLAHDLHDSLGGSLVRSIAFIDQSQQDLSNQQFLSMLKILRDDLRQIIDSGSSSGMLPPATPMLWGAAIRYRFMQIFDELDIQSEWSFPEQWLHQPSALECLTLLRIIEECLTNIIKHSHARHVSINLYYNEAQRLILDIIDDGIGFDVDAVLTANFSIGLRSMQTRLKKINASLDIRSKPKHTLIRILTSDKTDVR